MRSLSVGGAKSLREWFLDRRGSGFSIAVGVVLHSLLPIDCQKRPETIALEVSKSNRNGALDKKVKGKHKKYDNRKVVMSCDFRSHYPGPSLPPSPSDNQGLF